MSKPQRRDLRFQNLDELVADARSVALQPHETTGNWNASQILLHVAGLIGVANRGTGIRLPLPIRLMGRVFKTLGVHRRRIPAGLKAPPVLMTENDANAQVPVEEAVATLEREVAEAQAKPMSHPGPLFGKMSHDDRVTVHCRRAELHFSFLRPTDSADWEGAAGSRACGCRRFTGSPGCRRRLRGCRRGWCGGSSRRRRPGRCGRPR